VRVLAWLAICAARSERAAILQIGRDARGAKHVVSDTRGDTSSLGAPLNHRIGVGLGQGIAGQLPGRAAVTLEQKRLQFVRLFARTAPSTYSCK
jgi:hypothetical protein